eukprot:470847_1
MPTINSIINDIDPTLEPTNNPTLEPTFIPSINPTYITNIPTYYPTITPTIITLKPTLLPSKTPTLIPTILPSNNPTKTPTKTIEGGVTEPKETISNTQLMSENNSKKSDNLFINNGLIIGAGICGVCIVIFCIILCIKCRKINGEDDIDVQTHMNNNIVKMTPESEQDYVKTDDGFNVLMNMIDNISNVANDNGNNNNNNDDDIIAIVNTTKGIENDIDEDI